MHATGPNQAWSWDISRLRGSVIRSWFYLYVVLDIFSRKIVAWSIDTIESDKVAKGLITRSLSRRRTSNDNPYGEAAFKTVKYRPDYPDRFESLDQARSWMRRFVYWYNQQFSKQPLTASATEPLRHSGLQRRADELMI